MKLILENDEVKAWNRRLSRIVDYWNRYPKANSNRWDRKLQSLLHCWNVWYYQIIGQRPTQFTPVKKYFNWHSRLAYINQQWNYQLRMGGWNRRLDCLRRAWIDAGKQIKGGIGNMDPEMKNERIKMVDLRAMLSKQNHKCALTGRELTSENCSIDHIVPLSKGGTHSIDNAQLVVAEANHAKGSLTQDEFGQLCRDVLGYADSKSK